MPATRGFGFAFGHQDKRRPFILANREAAFQIKFGRWLKHRYKGASAAFELKRTLGKSLPFSEIKPHQWDALKAAKRGLYHKIPDDSRAQKPFDCFFLAGDAFLAIAYGPILRGFYLIDVAVAEEIRKTGARSITEERAKEYGEYYAFPVKEKISTASP